MSKSVRKLSVLVLAFFAFVALSLGAFVFQAKADVTTSDLITIASAAEVRLDDAEKEGDNTGIRFVITAQKAAIEAEYEGYEVSYGAVLIPTSYLGGEELDAAVKTYGTYNVLDVPAVNTIGDDEVVKFAAVLTNIPTSFYNTEISARGYAKLTNGEDVVYLQTEDVVSRSFGYVVASKIAHGDPTLDEKVILDGYMNDYIIPAINAELHGAELASFDSREYETMFSYGRGSAEDYSIEYLDSFSGKTGVIKISGTAANTLVLHLTLPKAMTPTKTGTQTAGAGTIKVKDAEGNDTAEDRIFDLTSIAADIYVANAGTSAFGFWQSIFDGDRDAGWGGKNYAPALETWKTYTLDLITSDTLRFGVAAGDFEFYVAGIYQGTELDVNKTLISETLGEDELANFDSQDYLKLITNDPVYGGRPSTAEIGTFHGKDNVLRITMYTVNSYRLPIYLPKNPTGDKITIQFYLEGGSGFRFGLLGIDNPGWMGSNHSTTYETNQWVTVVYTGFSNFANATYPMLRFNTDVGTAPDAIYIAGIWDGDQSGAILGKEILSTLGENELANFDSQDYLELLTENNIYGGKATAQIGTFQGKDNVLKIDATSANFITLNLPKSPTQTTITLQVYLVGGANSARFGMHYQDRAGWMNASPTNNHSTAYARDRWTMLVWHGIDNTGTYNKIDFSWEGQNGITEIYIAGIWDGDQISAVLAETLGENELANFDSKDYEGLVTGATAEIGTFQGKENVIKLVTNSAYTKIMLPKAMTAGADGKSTVTIQMYLETAGLGYGSFGVLHGSWANGQPMGGDDWNATAVGAWTNQVVTVEACDYIQFYASPAVGTITFYISVITQDDIPEIPETEAQYTIEYYLQNVANNEYTLSDARTETFTGTIGEIVTATPSAIDYFAFNSALSTVSGVVAQDGSLVLKLYYTRNTYAVTATANIAEAGEISGTGTFKYGAQATLTATTNDGYVFLGWYNGTIKVSEEATYTFAVNGSISFTAKWKKVESFDEIKARLSETLGENELANFDSAEYTKLITNEPVYGGRPETVEIGTFKGKDNVLKVIPYSGSGVRSTAIMLPKNPTGDAITIQFYIVGSEGGRVGLLGYNNAGWMNPNHSIEYARGEWVTVVYTGFSDFANAEYPYIRFNVETGVEEVYIAGIWDGDVSDDLENPSEPDVPEEPEVTESLQFVLINGDTEYEVSGYTGTPIEVVIPATYKGKPVTSIGNNAFSNCSSLTSVTFGENSQLINIGEFAFGCPLLTSIEIPYGVTTIGFGAFATCSSLRSIVIPDSVTDCGDAFATCPIEYITAPACALKYFAMADVKEVIITSGESIDDYVLGGAKNLTSIIIPDSVISIGDFALYDCDSLTSITFGANSKLTTIGEYVLADCDLLESVVIPVSVTSIHESAFIVNNSLNIVYYGGTAEDWEGISIDTTDNEFFIDATRYYYYENESDVPTDGGNYWHYVDGVPTVWEIADTPEVPEVTEGLQFALINGDTEYEVSDYTGTATEVVIPATYNGKLVTSIGNSAFRECSSLTSVVIGESVTSIGDWAFFNCSSLTSIVIPDSVTSIGDSAFENCSSLTSVVIGDSVTSIGNSAFYFCTSLTSIVIPESVTSIEDGAFDYCNSLESVYYGGNAEDWAKISIGSYGNYYLTNATRYYYYENESDVPTDGGNYWHYVDGVPTVWEIANEPEIPEEHTHNNVNGNCSVCGIKVYTVKFQLTTEVVLGIVDGVKEVTTVNCDVLSGGDLDLSEETTIDEITLVVAEGQTLGDLGISVLPSVTPINEGLNEYEFSGYWGYAYATGKIKDVNSDTIFNDENITVVSEDGVVVLVPHCTSLWFSA